MKDRRIITRRDFLRGTAYGALAATLSPVPTKPAEGQPKARVVLIRDERVTDEKGRINPKVLEEMLDEGLCRLLDEGNPLQAWKRLVKPSDVVGIKSNVWQPLPTPNELEEALVRRMMDAGVRKANIAVEDRGVLNHPVFKASTALINVRPLRTHHWAGIGGCLNNYIMFVSSPWLYHADACSPLATIWSKPIVKGKTRLNILSSIRTQFYNRGAHHFDPRFVSEYKGLLMGTDPVAVHAVGARLLQLQRVAHFGEDRPLDQPPTHIFVADTKYKLGVSDLRRIDLVKVGWMENALLYGRKPGGRTSKIARSGRRVSGCFYPAQ